ncbi:MAG TPA: tetratricopeptide repeat protein [Chryseolinea sp.]
MDNLAKLKILFLAAEPSDSAKLRLGKELMAVRERLKDNQYFIVKDQWAVKPADVLETILEEKPHIVHFSGHGTESGELCLEDEQGKLKTVTADALSKLFKLASDHVKCVILNTCFSELQAKAISQFIPVVIGTKKEIADAAAIKFSTGFYTTLSPDLSQKSFKIAFDRGCVSVQFDSLPDHLTPTLIEGLPEVRFTAEVDAAFLSITDPKGASFNVLKKGLILAGKKMGLQEEIVKQILDEKIENLKLHIDAIKEYEESLAEILRSEYPLSESSNSALRQLQLGLNLNDEEVETIKRRHFSDPKINTPETWYDRGRAKVVLGSYDVALEYFKKAIEKDKDYSGAYFEKGFAHEKKKEFDLAIDAYSKAIDFNNKWESNTNLSLAYYNRGLSYFSIITEDEEQKRSNMLLALKNWDESIAINPKEPNAYFNRGLVYEFLEKLDDAIENFKVSFEMPTDDKRKSQTADRIARCYSILANFEEAQKWTDVATRHLMEV